MIHRTLLPDIILPISEIGFSRQQNFKHARWTTSLESQTLPHKRNALMRWQNSVQLWVCLFFLRKTRLCGNYLMPFCSMHNERTASFSAKSLGNRIPWIGEGRTYAISIYIDDHSQDLTIGVIGVNGCLTGRVSLDVQRSSWQRMTMGPLLNTDANVSWNSV